MKLLKILALLGLAGTAWAGPSGPAAGNYITNVSTFGAQSAIKITSATINAQLSLPYTTANQCLQTNSANNVISAACITGGSGGSILTVNQNSVQITSPTLGINALSPPFRITSVGAGTTAQFTLDSSSVTLLGNTFNGSSQLIQATFAGALPAISATNLTNIPSANLSGAVPVANLTNAVINQNTLQSGSTFFVSSGTVQGQLSANSLQVQGTGNAQITMTVGASTYTVVYSSGPLTVGQCVVVSATTGAMESIPCPTGGGGGGAGNPGGSFSQLQYNNAGVFGGVSNSVVTSTVVIVSTLSVLNNTTTSANVNPGLLDVYSQSPHPVNLATFGSSSFRNILNIPNNNFVDMSSLGSQSGSLVTGDTQGGGAGWGNRIYSLGDNNAFLDFRTLGTSTGTWQTTTGSGPGDMRLLPGGVLTQTLSTQSGTIVYSSFSVVGSGLFNKYGIISSSVQVNQTSTGTAGMFSVSPSPGASGQAFSWEFDSTAVGVPQGYLGFSSSGGSNPGGLSIFNNSKNEEMRFANSSGGVWVDDQGGLSIKNLPSTTNLAPNNGLYVQTGIVASTMSLTSMIVTPTSATVTGSGGLGLNTPLTFGLGSTGGHNIYKTIYNDVGTNSAISGWDNANQLGYFWEGATTANLMTLNTTSGTLTVTYGIQAATATITGSTVSINGVASSYPSAVCTNGQVLQSNGATPQSWTCATPAGGSPGGSNQQVQFNNSGSFGGASSVTWNGQNLLIGGTTIPAYVEANNCLFDYRMDEGAGTSLTNHCGTSGNASFSAGAQAPTWASDGGLKFTLSKQSVIISTNDWQNLRTFTIAVKPDIITQYGVPGAGNAFSIILGSQLNGCLLSWDVIRQNPYVGGPANNNNGTLGNQRATGINIITYVLSSPNKLYINGQEESGYMQQHSLTPAASGHTSALMGDWPGSVNNGYGFSGELYYATASSVTWTAGQVASNYAAIRAMLRNRGVEIDVRQRLGPLQFIEDGDSISAGAGVSVFNQTYESKVSSAIPFAHQWQIASYSGQLLSANVTNGPTIIDPLVQFFQDSKSIVHLNSGFNDLSNSVTPTTLYGNLQSYMNARRGNGAYTIAHTVTNGTGGVQTNDANRLTYNACIASGSIGINSGCGGGQLNVNAVDYSGNDPYMGVSLGYLNYPGFYADSIHPSESGNAVMASYVAPAYMKAAGYGYMPICNRYTFSVSASSWTMGVNGNTALNVVMIATNTVQAVPMYFLGPKYKLSSANIRPTTAFSGTGYTSFSVNLGDSIGGNTFYTSANQDLTAANPTAFKDYTINASTSTLGSNINAVFTANQNMAPNAFAGSVDIDLCISSIP